ncbi:MAG: DUF4390 domain-containing protein [Mariprofundaceae bacterium]|nr:DUF4390 domain-containing protein [Mariprofundaceae bacterium]
MLTFLFRALPHFALCVLLYGQFLLPAHAAGGMQLQVAVEGDVLTCSASPTALPDGLERALREGSEISVNWHISVEIERKYWLNKSMGDIKLNRRVIPDLVSRSWLLEDQTSGITRRVFVLREATDFLTMLQNFPVLDRSLLNAGQAYVVKVVAREREGDVQNSWWRAWLGGDNISASSGFTLP